MSVGAVLLVGGEGRRLGGIAKPLLVLGGRTLLERAVDALSAAGAGPIVAVGPELDETAPVFWVREEPPLGGPAAALAAGIREIRADWAYLLAGDLVRPEGMVQRLAERLTEGTDAEGIAFTAGGREQWLAGVYRTASVRRALAELGPPTGASIRAVLGGLAIDWIVDEDGVTRDIDSPADLDRARTEPEESP